MDSSKSKVDRALAIAYMHGQTDGGHHKAWVIDQMVRRLAGDDYGAWVERYKAGNEGPDTYEWSVGIAP